MPHDATTVAEGPLAPVKVFAITCRDPRFKPFFLKLLEGITEGVTNGYFRLTQFGGIAHLSENLPISRRFARSITDEMVMGCGLMKPEELVLVTHQNCAGCKTLNYITDGEEDAVFQKRKLVAATRKLLPLARRCDTLATIRCFHVYANGTWEELAPTPVKRRRKKSKA